MQIINKILINITGNKILQIILDKIVHKSQYFMGIGSGSEVLTSGELAIFDILKSRQQPPYCIFDIGSNKGQFLKLIIDNISTDKYYIHCFEPSHETFKYLSEYIKNDKRIILNNIGMGNNKGVKTLYYDDYGSELASLSKRKLDHIGIEFNKSENVNIDTIDNYCSDNKIDKIHLMKLDIEGHELDALAGAIKMFENKAIDIILFEFGGCNIDTRSFFRDIWYFYMKYKMKLYRITPSGYLMPIERYKEDYEQFRTTNYIAINNG